MPVHKTRDAVRHPQRGFTLVELVCVLVILGSLTSIMVPLYQQWMARAIYAALQKDALTAYSTQMAAHGRYLVTTTDGQPALDVPGFADGTADFNRFGLLVGSTHSLASVDGHPTNAHCAEVARLVLGTQQVAAVSSWTAVAAGVSGMKYVARSYWNNSGTWDRDQCIVFPVQADGRPKQVSSSSLPTTAQTAFDARGQASAVAAMVLQVSPRLTGFVQKHEVIASWVGLNGDTDPYILFCRNAC